uniref:Citrate transporter-like domain-containing protein n=1 Tax=Chromera velia CCMP2878 TaxID=1169474 RepID=A0A0G4I6W9_9ALVE|mmetsp:Transcript_20379/g.40828  ORF Transcript_20379/g.40828 Transcript_20379/m.40828 type:complete len:584 (-) Transcript_20379:80-1831(-)|eukprot:Cvel_1916.t1-p1 / transcript=Cvel_1916.t1 / gene=Cvel_1916 / organism=Chromera_velia_CCMP2878 / gene_product=Putative malate transporter YflS, putative / transcript_product=Putative malate transporter YflS, putative / location=Cvel_scaffold71:148029-149777(+) / protein_length=583 / sequence_SO=supercontig / SO=protein_coding / is_pseudo=false
MKSHSVSSSSTPASEDSSEREREREREGEELRHKERGGLSGKKNKNKKKKSKKEDRRYCVVPLEVGHGIEMSSSSSGANITAAAASDRETLPFVTPSPNSTHHKKRHPPKASAQNHAVSYGLIVSLGIVAWTLEAPASLDASVWHLFIIFLGTIATILVGLPLVVASLSALCLAVVTGTLTTKVALSGFSSEVVWLVIFAFFIAKALEVTGLGRRCCFVALAMFGRSSLGLAYAVALAETILGSAIPSNTARGAGIVLPILKPLLTDALGSDPVTGTEKKVGSYLVLSAWHSNCVSSSMFLTGCGVCALMAKLAKSTANLDISWWVWFSGSCVPGGVCALIVPYLLYLIYPPQQKDTRTAQQVAGERLAELGPVKWQELLTGATFVLLVVMWIVGDLAGLCDATTTALVGVSVLLLSGVLSVKDVVHEHAAFGILLWFPPLLVMADALTKGGMFDLIGSQISQTAEGFALSWPVVLVLTCLCFYYSHYVFASLTAHAAALYATFLTVCISAGAPALPSALALAYLSPLSGCVTQFSSGPAPSYFALGYVPLSDWWRYGFVISLLHVGVYLTVGMAWWKVLGLY